MWAYHIEARSLRQELLNKSPPISEILPRRCTVQTPFHPVARNAEGAGHHPMREWEQVTSWNEDILLPWTANIPIPHEGEINLGSAQGTVTRFSVLAAECDPETDTVSRTEGLSGCLWKSEPRVGGQSACCFVLQLYRTTTFKTKCNALINVKLYLKKITPQGLVRSAVNFNFKTKIRCVFLGQF